MNSGGEKDAGGADAVTCTRARGVRAVRAKVRRQAAMSRREMDVRGSVERMSTSMSGVRMPNVTIWGDATPPTRKYTTAPTSLTSPSPVKPCIHVCAAGKNAPQFFSSWPHPRPSTAAPSLALLKRNAAAEPRLCTNHRHGSSATCGSHLAADAVQPSGPAAGEEGLQWCCCVRFACSRAPPIVTSTTVPSKPLDISTLVPGTRHENTGGSASSGSADTGWGGSPTAMRGACTSVLSR
eukprot:TRINITY_DN14021_c0_g1_i1.p2 TRINITY_DN14021_c0_g1~~TRINITY_DN14021_c0_g1_i1.p2  ORF type:complete len:278 (+),score=-52.69 TRINITY_DN14021_c0_g1_i1:122-835(+)